MLHVQAAKDSISRRGATNRSRRGDELFSEDKDYVSFLDLLKEISSSVDRVKHGWG